jgi:hypothetical protein
MSQKKSTASASSRVSSKSQSEPSEITQATANRKKRKMSQSEENQQGHIMQLLSAAETLNVGQKSKQMDKPAPREGNQNQRTQQHVKQHSSGHHSFPSQSVVDRTTASGANSLRRRDGFFMFSLAMHEHIRRKMKSNVTHEMYVQLTQLLDPGILEY